ncbi:hypothetical protein GGR50DRAFT_160474 [Xylaria sp. CBS 124048]|nr:hypothetical protein GGR50DRAFT_160474 [Xylaria sp. CBS 124048]
MAMTVSTTRQQQTQDQIETQTPSPSRRVCPFEPSKTNPSAAESFVRNLFKQKPHNLSVAATELAPLFGFGPDSTRDVIARLRTQAIFASRDIGVPYSEFATRYTRGRWDLPVASWGATMLLVRAHASDAAFWSSSSTSSSTTSSSEEEGNENRNNRPIIPDNNQSHNHDHDHSHSHSHNHSHKSDARCPEIHYARFLLAVIDRLRRGVGVPWMMMWLRDALTEGREEDVCWVLFHTLMYLQLEGMRYNRERAPFREVAGHFVHKVVSGRRKSSSLRGALPMLSRRTDSSRKESVR